MQFDYLGFLFSSPHVSAIGVCSIFFLTFIRIVTIMTIAPFLGAKLIPAMMRIGFAIALVFLFLPVLVMRATQDVQFDFSFLLLSAKEALIGFVMGFLASVPFYIAEGSGTIIDNQRGASSMMGQSFTMQSQTSSLGILYNNMLLVIFFEIGGVFFFISALFKSFELVPVYGWINPNFFIAHSPFWTTTFGVMHTIMAISIQLAAPAIVAILMAEAFLGIANRLAPQVQIAFLGISLKSFLGLLILFLAWFVILKNLGSTSFDWIKTLSNLLPTMASS